MTPGGPRGQQGLPAHYASPSADAGYDSRKRSHSTSQALQNPPFLEGQAHAMNEHGPPPGFSNQWSTSAPMAEMTEATQNYRNLAPQRPQELDINDRDSGAHQLLERAMASSGDNFDAVSIALSGDHAIETDQECVDL